MASFEHLSDADMADEITTWAGRVAAGEARLIELIAEFDWREAWAEVGVLSCAHWLSWRLGMGLKAAYERVRVAQALTGLPATTAVFLGGRLSWTRSGPSPGWLPRRTSRPMWTWPAMPPAGSWSGWSGVSVGPGRSSRTRPTRSGPPTR